MRKGPQIQEPRRRFQCEVCGKLGDEEESVVIRCHCGFIVWACVKPCWTAADKKMAQHQSHAKRHEAGLRAQENALNAKLRAALKETKP